MKDLPNPEHPGDAFVVRADYSDEAAWVHLRNEIETLFGEFRDYVSFVSDPDFDGLDIGTLTSFMDFYEFSENVDADGVFRGFQC
jgi:hypothetical protein